MLATVTVTVEANWLDTGHFLIWGRDEHGFLLDARELKCHLFAWDRKTFFGTAVETAKKDRIEGLILNAATASDLFFNLPYNPIVQWIWSENCLELIRLAPLLKQALQEQRMIPDYGHLQVGRIRWKLPLVSPYPWVEDWAHLAAEAYVDEHPALSARRARLLKKAEVIQRFSGANPFTESDPEWLTFAEWEDEDAPFETGLILTEPDDTSDNWKLAPVLKDPSSTKLVMCDEQGLPLDDLHVPEFWRKHLRKLRKDFLIWRHLAPWIAVTTSPDAKDSLLKVQLNDGEAWEFLAELAPQLEEMGYFTVLPEWWGRIRRQRPKLKAVVRTQDFVQKSSVLGLSDIVDYDWKLSLGDMELTEEEFKSIAQQQRRLMNIRGKWVHLDPGMIQQIRHTLHRKKNITLLEALQRYLTAEEQSKEENGEIEPTGAASELSMQFEFDAKLRHLIRQLNEPASIPDVEPPALLQGTLRKYQLTGVSWLLFLRSLGFGGCLADDMGLGKTVQYIAYLLKVREQEKSIVPSLLICPTSVIGNWQKELSRFAPSLSIYLHYGPDRCKEETAFQEAVQGYQLVLTSYSLAHLDAACLAMVHWNSLCLDEAQNIKNAHTKQSSAIRKLKAGHRIAMTGTPIENRLTELWSIFDFINPGYLGSLRQFSGRFIHPYERSLDMQYILPLQRMVQPFILRRAKTDAQIKADLPDKFESKDYVPLSPEQAALYENVVRDLFDKVDRTTGMGRRGLILSGITKLKQVCGHPSLYLKEHWHVREWPQEEILLWIERSNKIKRLLEMILELKEAGDRCLIFTQYVRMGLLLQALLRQKLHEPIDFLHGGLSKTRREEIIEGFNVQTGTQEPTTTALILSLKAGGTGLNLTAANHVFHFDRWWNPAVENQATDRAFRIGQSKHVHVHKLITLGTLEERIDELIERKRGLSAHLVGSGENWITELSTDDLKEVFMLRRDWIHMK